MIYNSKYWEKSSNTQSYLLKIKRMLKMSQNETFLSLRMEKIFLLTLGLILILCSQNNFALPKKQDPFRQQLHDFLQSNHRPISYNDAKKWVLGDFHLKQEGNQFFIQEVYCDRWYGPQDFESHRGPGRHILPDDTVLNIEHTWPQSKFSDLYSKDIQKSDMHNLFPSDSKMNSSRSSYPFGEIQGEERILKCETSHLSQSLNPEMPLQYVFTPPPKHKGNVARALFYFAVRYELEIDEEQEATLKKWNTLDPVDNEENSRNLKIKKIQGIGNPFIEHPEWVDEITNY